MNWNHLAKVTFKQGILCQLWSRSLRMQDFVSKVCLPEFVWHLTSQTHVVSVLWSQCYGKSAMLPALWLQHYGPNAIVKVLGPQSYGPIMLWSQHYASINTMVPMLWSQ